MPRQYLENKVLRTIYIKPSVDDWFTAEAKRSKVTRDELFEEAILLGMIVANITPRNINDKV